MNLLSNNDLNSIEHALHRMDEITLYREGGNVAIKVSTVRAGKISARLWQADILIHLKAAYGNVETSQIFASVDDLICALEGLP